MTTQETSALVDVDALFNLEGIVRDAIQSAKVERTVEQELQDEPRIEIIHIMLAQTKAQAAYGGPVPPAAQRAAFVEQLAQRIRLRAARRTEPERFERPIQRPLVVTGLMRTGTTLLFNLLATQQDARAPKLWELWTPVPISNAPNESEIDPRILAAEQRAHWIQNTLPAFRLMHEIDAHAPEECTFLMMEDFCNEAWMLSMENPPYAEWFLRQDIRDFYRHHRLVLSFLDSFRPPPSHWVLKSPYHLGRLEEFFDVYPDANIVVTHRNPIEVVASTISLLTLPSRTFVPNFDPRPTAKTILRNLAATWRSAKVNRDKLTQTGHGAQILDVAYRDLMTDPVSAVQSIYQHFDYKPSATMADEVRAHLAANPKNKAGVHKYSLEQFGLSPAEVETELSEYIATYGHLWR